MKYWLVKSEPFKYSWNMMLKDKVTYWDGVRNYQARNNLKSMKKGDFVMFYHSNEGKEIVGITKVVKEFYQDPTTNDDRWVVVDLKVFKSLKRSISLQEIKGDNKLTDIGLIKQSRLSVMEISKQHYDHIIKLSNEI
jgi:predicted RNA-binding protein with PUA-like domain|tara:strand:+ start:175 stop:585 length:411 start_codon:yes stop_codon:yes gene_type:complete